MSRKGTRRRLRALAATTVVGGALGLGLLAAPGLAHGSHHRATAHAAIIGGTSATIGQAPWTVFILVYVNDLDAWSCDGVILDSTHVLTAGHCLYDDDGPAPTLAPASDFYVYADQSNVSSVIDNVIFDPTFDPSVLPFVGVTSTRPDPSYDPTGEQETYASEYDAYDIGVLTLASPLTLNNGSGQAPQAISFGSSGSPAPSSTVSMSGFGLESPPQVGEGFPDGSLNTLSQTVAPVGMCVLSVDALVGCSTSPSGSTCSGDSGSAITGPGNDLVGIVDAGTIDADGNLCDNGSITFFAKVTTPELTDFIDGSANPPAAPQGGVNIGCDLSAPVVGATISCSPGSWTGSPSFTYEFVDDNTGQVLQSGSSASYVIQPSDVGRAIYFLAIATNAGGTGTSRTVDTSPIQSAPAVTTTSTQTTNVATSSPAPSTTTSSTTTTTSRSTTTTLTQQPKPRPQPALHVSVNPGHVRPGSHLTLHVTLLAGTSPLSRVRVCADVPAHASVASASGASVKKGVACWTVNVRADGEHVVSIVLAVAKHAKAGSMTLAATATWSRGHELSGRTRVSVS